MRQVISKQKMDLCTWDKTTLLAIFDCWNKGSRVFQTKNEMSARADKGRCSFKKKIRQVKKWREWKQKNSAQVGIVLYNHSWTNKTYRVGGGSAANASFRKKK